MKLNPEQETAANHHYGACLATACPGSGKTRTLVERTVRMVESGIPRSKILAITFTNKAAAEMKDRVAKRMKSGADELFISTFHRLCSTILRQYGQPLGYKRYMSILMEDEQQDLLAQLARKRELELTKPAIKKLVWIVNDSRENLETDEQLFERFDDAKIEEQYYVAKDYLNSLRANNQIDFSGLLSETYELLTKHPNVLADLHARWSHFQVDEVQDTNLAQFKIIDLLAKHTKNVFLVGDPDQSIYGWRGARMENLFDFQKTYPGCKVIKFGKNYRSTPQIVGVADKLIRHNGNRLGEKFETDNPAGHPVQCLRFLDDKTEAEEVAKMIHKLVENKVCKYKQVAVFYRKNAMSRAVEMAFLKEAVPHTVVDSHSFFDRKEVKDCVAMLRFLVNPSDGVAFHRIANKPKRALGDVTIGKIEKLAHDEKISILDAIDGMNFKSPDVRAGLDEIKRAFTIDFEKTDTAAALQHILKTLRYEDWLKEDKETYQDRKENVEQVLIDAAKDKSIESYLERIALVSGGDKEVQENSVSLMSLHASKGLEFPVVFMIGVEQGILPHKKACQERPDGLEEERRLCYVGMTRAERILITSYCARRQEMSWGSGPDKKAPQVKSSPPSQFLIEAGLLKPKSPQITANNLREDRYC